MALIDEYQASLDVTFINRCYIAAVAFAVLVVESEDPSTANHANRVAYAKAVVNNPGAYAASLATGVIALNASSSGGSLSDTAVSNSIAAIWNMFAGL